jgi:GTPase
MNKAECTIVVCGPVDAGKSSIIGVLTSGKLDNGRGLARNRILVHPHERESGRTSHISYNPLVYLRKDNDIMLCNPKDKNDKQDEQNKIIRVRNKLFWENKITNFVDLAGHEKYLKTTLFGVTGLFPDYGIVVIGANTGITKLTREHLGILLYLHIPFIITITKIDLAPKQVYQSLCLQLKKLLGRNTFGKVLYFISDSEKNNEETDNYINHMIENPDVIPVISVSNKEGNNIDNLHQILYSLTPRPKWKQTITDGSIFYVDSIFNVSGIGIVLSGINKGKPIKIKQKMYLGPFNGSFKEVIVKSLHNSIKENIEETISGLQACVAIRLSGKDTLEKSMIMKGMVLVDDVNKYKKFVTRSFYAKINVLQHSTTIKTGYSPVIHCGPIRQSATIDLTVGNDSEEIKSLRSGDSRVVKFTFNYRPEFMEDNMIFFFRDGSTKGVGEIIKITE